MAPFHMGPKKAASMASLPLWPVSSRPNESHLPLPLDAGYLGKGKKTKDHSCPCLLIHGVAKVKGLQLCALVSS
jgi:hypothetical protein